MFSWELTQTLPLVNLQLTQSPFNQWVLANKSILNIAFLFHFLAKSPNTMNTPWVLGFNWKTLLTLESYQRLRDSEATYKPPTFSDLFSTSATHFNEWFRLQSQLFSLMLGTEKSTHTPKKTTNPQNQKLCICIKYSSWAFSLISLNIHACDFFAQWHIHGLQKNVMITHVNLSV